MPAADPHGEPIGVALQPGAAVHVDQDLRSDLLPNARDRMKECRLDLGERLEQVLRFFTDMGYDVRDQHQAQTHRALDQMSERKMGDGAMRTDLELGKALQIGVHHSHQEVAVGDHRGFRRAGRAGGVDEDRDAVGLNGGRAVPEQARLVPLQNPAAILHVAEAQNPIVVVKKHRPHVGDDDVPQIGREILQIQHLVDVFLILGNEDRRTSVLELVAHLGGRACGIDAVSDRPDAEPGEIRDEIFETGVTHHRDAITSLDAEREKPEREGFDFVVILPPSDLLIEAEVLVTERDFVRPRFDAFKEKLRHALSVNRPGSRPVLLRNAPARLHDPITGPSIMVFQQTIVLHIGQVLRDLWSRRASRSARS
jgi:hypothetical protein